MARNTSYFLLVWGYFLESVECDLVTLIVKLVTVKMKTQNCVIVEVHWCVMLRRKYNLKCTINHYYIELCVNVRGIIRKGCYRMKVRISYHCFRKNNLNSIVYVKGTVTHSVIVKTSTLTRCIQTYA